MKTTSPPWEILLLLLVIIIMFLAVSEAVKQHKEKENWERLVETKLSRLDVRISNIEDNSVMTKEFISNTQHNFIDEQNYLRDYITQALEVTSYKTVAGCYGVVPTNGTSFSLLCNKEFHWN